jgi:hypothetical protein
VSSVRASSIRSRSLESMTKMRPWVPALCISRLSGDIAGEGI